MTEPTNLQEPLDFSLVMGGPLYQILRRAHLSGSAMEQLLRRMLVLPLLAWLPLLALSAFEGHVIDGHGLSFLHDVESHIRFLVALPVLIFAELIVHQRIRPVVRRFMERGVITPEETSKYYAAIEAALRARNSVWPELALVVFVYTVGHWIWRHELALDAATWYAVPDATGMRLTLAGYWYAFISIPIFQFILLRWYFRLAIWFQFLGRVSKLNLHLTPIHPDRTGGIRFLGGTSYAFSPILFAQGAVLAGLIASRILYHGESLMAFKVSFAALIVLFVLAILGPLTMFTPHLFRAKNRGLNEYGMLATKYAADFDAKWFHGGAKGDAVLGTADIQSQSDLANSYATVSEMRLVPFDLRDAVQLAAATAAPALPLLLTIMPLEELVRRLLKIIF